MVIGNQCHVTEAVKAQKGNGFTFSTVSYVSLGLLCVYYLGRSSWFILNESAKIETIQKLDSFLKWKLGMKEKCILTTSLVCALLQCINDILRIYNKCKIRGIQKYNRNISNICDHVHYAARQQFLCKFAD